MGVMLGRSEVVSYVGQNASRFGLDPAAVLAVANQEGLNTSPGSTWRIPGESGFNFGPPSWYSGGAGGAIVNMQGGAAAVWAWTTEGIDYWLQQVSSAASGLSGSAAISAIVHGFERPREDLAAGEIQRATNQYAAFQQELGQPGEPAPSAPAPDTSGGSTPTGGQPSSGGNTPAKPTTMQLSFADTLGHTATQAVLVFIGIALLLGGIYLIGSRS